MSVTDRIIFSTPGLKVGVFRCTADDPHFADSGPIENHIVVFPRTGVWICHEGSKPFVADPKIATIYNRGQQYTRSRLSDDGDRCDWFSVSPEFARAIMEDAAGTLTDDPDRPFAAEFLSVTPELYAMQRRVVRLIERGAEQSQIEELALGVLAATIRGPGLSRGVPRRKSRTSALHRELAMNCRAELTRCLFEPLDLTDLSDRLGVSPWHLCRVFKEQTGTTIHAYRSDLRLRRSLEQLEPSSGGISMLAHRCGFSSHSHFTAAFRKQFGFTPSEGGLKESIRH